MNWISDWVLRMDPCTPRTPVTGSQGTPYPCATISAVDRHISRLYDQILRTDRRAEVVEELWVDIDLLLDRRMLLKPSLGVSDAA